MQDVKYGMRFLLEAAKGGHMEAQHNYGAKLYFGEDIPIYIYIYIL